METFGDNWCQLISMLSKKCRNKFTNRVVHLIMRMRLRVGDISNKRIPASNIVIPACKYYNLFNNILLKRTNQKCVEIIQG